jgi:hypothetical protein
VEAGLALVLARARHFDVLSSRHETKTKEATTAVANYGISSFDTYTGIPILSDPCFVSQWGLYLLCMIV